MISCCKDITNAGSIQTNSLHRSNLVDMSSLYPSICPFCPTCDLVIPIIYSTFVEVKKRAVYRFSKYKEQYRKNLILAIPVVLSQLGQIIVQVADNAMVGHYGGDDPTPLAAVSFGGGIFFIIFVSIMGLTFGITPLVGELFAQKRTTEPAKYLQNSILIYSVAAILLSLVQFAIIPIMWRMGQPAEVVEMAIPYYRMLVWSLFPCILFFTFKQFLEGVGNTKVAMYIVVFCNVVNIIFNHMFIGGEWGAPEMGALGAGLATLLSRIMLAIIIICYFIRSSQFKIYRDRFARYNFSWSAMTRLIRLGFPISSQIFFEASSFVGIGFLFGLFGAVAIGANQIATTLGNCSFMIIVAIGSATTIRVSHCYGLRDTAQMRLAGKAAWHLGIVWNIFMAIVYMSLRSYIPLIFTTNQEVLELASVLLVTIAAYQITDGIQCIGVGILRGMQDVKIIPLIAFISYWLFNIPIAYICAFHLDMGSRGLYMGFMVGFTLASILLYWRIKYRLKQLHLNEFR